jgi:hypothetical protein
MRRQVVERAGCCCEYCLIHQDLVASTHQVDHVVSEKHGGETSFENLALSCMACNLRKASDLASFDPLTGQLVSLFNPRTSSWSDHFELIGAEIVGKSPIGRTTVEFLQLNRYERVIERAEFMRAGVYPKRSY